MFIFYSVLLVCVLLKYATHFEQKLLIIKHYITHIVIISIMIRIFLLIYHYYLLFAIKLIVNFYFVVVEGIESVKMCAGVRDKQGNLR